MDCVMGFDNKLEAQKDFTLKTIDGDIQVSKGQQFKCFDLRADTSGPLMLLGIDAPSMLTSNVRADEIQGHIDKGHWSRV